MKLFLPETMEALWHLYSCHPQALVYAGGTDLMVKARAGTVKPDVLICLERITELRGVREADGEILIGACTTHTTLLEDPVIAARFPVLQKAVRTLGSPPIRNMGTLGGNICTASPAGDTLPPLYLLDAEIEVRSRDGSRRVPIERFIHAPGKTDLRPGEVLYNVAIGKTDDYTIHHFEKVGRRKAMSIAIASLAAAVRVDAGGMIERVRLAWGSVGPTIVTSRETEESLRGMPLSVDTLRSVFPSVTKAVSPIDDVRASAAYRRSISANLLLRLGISMV